MAEFSVIIPATDDIDHIDSLLASLFALDLPDLLPGSFEVILVGSCSRDGAPEKIYRWREHENVRLVNADLMPGLATSVLAGVAVAQSNVIVVMDAGLSYPPEQLAAVVAPLLDAMAVSP